MSGKWWLVRIGNRSGGGHVVKTLLGFCPCYRHRPQPVLTRPPWLGERLFRTSCAKIATHLTKSQQSLNSTYTSTPIPYPHKPHHPTTKKLPSVCQPPYYIEPPPITTAREQRDQRWKVKTPRGGGLGVVVWFN